MVSSMSKDQYNVYIHIYMLRNSSRRTTTKLTLTMLVSGGRNLDSTSKSNQRLESCQYNIVSARGGGGGERREHMQVLLLWYIRSPRQVQPLRI
jgi:hypothetical protein